MKSKKYKQQYKNECFICFCNKKKVYLLSHIIDKKNCNCDAYVHKNCVVKWTSIKKTCPICNSNIENKILKHYNENNNYNDNNREFNIIIGTRNSVILHIILFIVYIYKIFFILICFSFFSVVLLYNSY